jgi:hypothetical protein
MRKDTPAQDSGFTFKSGVNVVLLPVVVHDRHSHAVGHLTKEDFQVFDRGEPHFISGFTIQKRAEVKKDMTAPALGPLQVIPRWAVTPDRFIVFQFDDLHPGVDEFSSATGGKQYALRFSGDHGHASCGLAFRYQHRP